MWTEAQRRFGPSALLCLDLRSSVGFPFVVPSTRPVHHRGRLLCRTTLGISGRSHSRWLSRPRGGCRWAWRMSGCPGPSCLWWAPQTPKPSSSSPPPPSSHPADHLCCSSCPRFPERSQPQVCSTGSCTRPPGLWFHWPSPGRGINKVVTRGFYRTRLVWGLAAQKHAFTFLLTIPKSPSLTHRQSESHRKTFSGLTSLWTKPRACRWDRAPDSWDTTRWQRPSSIPTWRTSEEFKRRFQIHKSTRFLTFLFFLHRFLH